MYMKFYDSSYCHKIKLSTSFARKINTSLLKEIEKSNLFSATHVNIMMNTKSVLHSASLKSYYFYDVTLLH